MWNYMRCAFNHMAAGKIMVSIRSSQRTIKERSDPTVNGDTIPLLRNHRRLLKICFQLFKYPLQMRNLPHPLVLNARM